MCSSDLSREMLSLGFQISSFSPPRAIRTGSEWLELMLPYLLIWIKTARVVSPPLRTAVDNAWKITSDSLTWEVLHSQTLRAQVPQKLCIETKISYVLSPLPGTQPGGNSGSVWFAAVDWMWTVGLTCLPDIFRTRANHIDNTLCLSAI